MPRYQKKKKNWFFFYSWQLDAGGWLAKNLLCHWSQRSLPYGCIFGCLLGILRPAREARNCHLYLRLAVARGERSRQENVISISFFFFFWLNISCLLSLDTLEVHFIWFQTDFLEVGFTWSLVSVCFFFFPFITTWLWFMWDKSYQGLAQLKPCSSAE